MITDEIWIPFEEDRSRHRRKPVRGRLTHTGNNEFTCLHCHTLVSSAVWLAGVHNRNHCPYCLWSRHLDLYEAGDRLAACKAPMRPAGLTLKTTRKKYGSGRGELMLVHLCSGCQRVSLNRVAADDIADTLYEVYETSLQFDEQVEQTLVRSGVTRLGCADVNVVTARLFGLDRVESGILN